VDEHPTLEQRDPLAKFVASVEHDGRLDAVVTKLAPLARRIAHGPQASLLRGDPLGHALHPMLTDLPIGFFTSSFLLDLVGGRPARQASQRLIGFGLISLVPTAAAGLVDWDAIPDAPRRRAGAAHAALNSAAALLYLSSWWQRRQNRHLRGVGLALAAATVTSAAGFLGGHLAFAQHTGVGERGEPDTPAELEDEHALDGKIGG
jgi:uncharacterized membrane protein